MKMLLLSRVIREQDPLKQGLKPQLMNLLFPHGDIIREQDPLKQGLKLDKLIRCHFINQYS